MQCVCYQRDPQRHSLFPFDKQGLDEIFGIVSNGIKGVVVEVELGAGDVAEGLGIVVAHERGQTRQPAKGVDENIVRNNLSPEF